MDSRRLQELRDVYARLSHQSTGATAAGAGAATGAVGASRQGGASLAGARGSATAVGGGASGQERTNEGGAQATPKHGRDNSKAPPNESQSEATGDRTSSVGDGAYLDLRRLGTNKSTYNDNAIASKGGNISNSASVPMSAASGHAVGYMPTPVAASSSVSSFKEELLEKDGSGHNHAGGRRRRGAGSRSAEALIRREISTASSDQDGGDGGGGGVSGGGGADGGGAASAGGGAGGGSTLKRRRKNKREGNAFYPRSYFDWNDELMENKLPDRSFGPFVSSIFELGLKHSSPKVLMKLMPPKADKLTTEHIKSRLQKYRLHAHRSKEEFLEFFSLRLKEKFMDFVQKEGWRNLSPRHGDEEEEDTDNDGLGEDAGGAVGIGVWSGGSGSAAGGGATVLSDSEEPLGVNVNGRMVGDIRDLGAQCVREQVNLQDILRHHIAAQLKLQAEIHDHLTTSATAAASSTQSQQQQQASSPPRPPPALVTTMSSSMIQGKDDNAVNNGEDNEALRGRDREGSVDDLTVWKNAGRGSNDLRGLGAAVAAAAAAAGKGSVVLPSGRITGKRKPSAS